MRPSEPDDEWHAAEYGSSIAVGVGIFFGLAIIDVMDFELGVLLLAWFGGWTAGHLSHVVAIRFRRLAYRHTRCAHGMPGGVTRERCRDCRKALESERRELEMQAAERARRRDLQAAAAQLRESERGRLVEQSMRQLNGLLRLSPRAFEDAIADLFRRMGYLVEQTPYSNDRGRDAILTKDGKLYLLECKRHGKGRSVGRRDLQVFFAAVIEAKAEEGFFVTTARCKSTADEFVRDKPIDIIDAPRLLELVQANYPEDGDPDRYRAMCQTCGDVAFRRLADPGAVVHCQSGHEISATLTLQDVQFIVHSKEPECPRCGSAMRSVSGRRGKFWGCTRYPTCRGTRDAPGDDARRNVARTAAADDVALHLVTLLAAMR